MPDYKELYFQLFNKVSDVISRLEKIQKEMEEMYINSTEDTRDEN